ncbi:YicC/YloC family endoribonuclease [Limnoglobus roseus]|uniref:YicC family protein n=1 Tax=Limnoglobus roseus TaxID=2598579 RepID=A0A5C1AGH0_9BACT|nr:YicC/YloC family endoribonuclease [Limnoglobus roseus]QEL17247.1 YicC family protein [Limnoglobus roseus]
MLLSMTGFGEARALTPDLAVSLEVRSVNNRHLKVTVRGSEPYPALEPDFEKVIRRTVKRGTLHLTVRVERQRGTNGHTLNTAVLTGYLQQIQAACPAATDTSVLLAALLALPGIAPEAGSRTAVPEEEWPLVERVLHEALTKLDAVRRDEGRAMADELLLHHRHIKDQLELVRQHLPRVMDDYRQRLLDRIRQAVASAGVTVEPEHLIRELAAYADRTDVSEEVTRLDAHLIQFEEVIRKESDGPGRRLEFVLQEMGRETNTLGSKAGDVTISRNVVEIKATLEKMKELVQNVE